MIKLLIKQGPFYITACTALFIALDNAGWFINLKPKLAEVAAPFEMADMAPEATEAPMMMFFSGDALPMTGGSLDFIEESGVEWWVALLALVIGTIIIGFTARKIWEFIFD